MQVWTTGSAPSLVLGTCAAVRTTLSPHRACLAYEVPAEETVGEEHIYYYSVSPRKKCL